MEPLIPVSATAEAVAAVVAACIGADGEPPLSEHKTFVVTETASGAVGCWQIAATPAVAAVAAEHRHADRGEHWALEVAVAPAVRSREEEALRSARTLVPPGRTHSLWSFRPEQQQAAATLGYRTFRRLLRMDAPLPMAGPSPVPGYRLRPFRPAEDEETIAAVNNRAFAGHRENDAMTPESIRARERLPWFDPEGFLVAHGNGDVVAGFCWTKRLGAVGEVYVIAVDPGHQGRGLGRWLVLAAFDFLHRERGATVARLWTDEDNPAVDGLYRPLGLAATLVNVEMSLEV